MARSSGHFHILNQLRIAPLLPFLVVGLLLAGGPVSSQNSLLATEDSSHDTHERLERALHVLQQTDAGKGLLAKARTAWKLEDSAGLIAVFKWGTVSRTDAVLTRHFNPQTGKESRERKVTIYLKRAQALEDLVLDIAHELTHATAGPTWDPYDPELTPGKYIWAAIEGEGGEVDALVSECEVSLELAEAHGTSAGRCRRYAAAKDSESRIEKEKVRRDFYRVGRWRPELGRKLKTELERFPLLTSDSPQLYSSTGHAPYPAALLREFEEITEVACENSRRRVTSFSDRAPATGAGNKALRDSAARFLSRRCPDVTPSSQAAASH